MNRPQALLRKAVDVRPNEVHALLLAAFFNFVILGSYYVIRPIRDDIAAASGVENLTWMFTGTLVVTLLANTAFSAIVARMPRRKFLPIGYRFFIANLLIFYFLMRTRLADAKRLGRARLLRLGERFQSLYRDALLGLHDGSVR